MHLQVLRSEITAAKQPAAADDHELLKRTMPGPWVTSQAEISSSVNKIAQASHLGRHRGHQSPGPALRFGRRTPVQDRLRRVARAALHGAAGRP